MLTGDSEMFLDFFNGETVTIKRKTSAGLDKYNREITTETETQVEAIVAFKGSSRTVDGEGTDFVTQLNLVFSENTDVRPDDTFIVRGTKWECDGWLLPQDGNQIPGDFLPADIYVPVKRIEK
jgi:hypothetical protein